MNAYHFCTYFDRNYASRGLALYRSLERHCRLPFTLWVLCFDDHTHSALSRLGLPQLRLIREQDFEDGDEALIAAKSDRDRLEYYWTCTASLLIYVLENNPEVEILTYLDADLYFFADPAAFYRELGCQSILISTHRFAPAYTHLASTCGIYNVGALAFRRDERGMACLRWWRARCIEWCHARFEDGKFGDQKYLDDWPERFEGVVISQYAGTGVGPWNLPGHEVGRDRGQTLIDGEPLVYFHFHGYRRVSDRVVEPTHILYRISRQQIDGLYRPYSEALREASMQLGESDPGALIEGEGTAALALLRGLLWQRYFLLRPRLASWWLWRIGAWRRDNGERVRAALIAHASGDSRRALRCLLSALWRNPLFLGRRQVVAVLWDCLLAGDRVGR